MLPVGLPLLLNRLVFSHMSTLTGSFIARDGAITGPYFTGAASLRGPDPNSTRILPREDVPSSDFRYTLTVDIKRILSPQNAISYAKEPII
jgi:hypothetical protein